MTQAQLPEHGYAPFHTPWLGEFHQHLNPSRDDRSGTPRLSDTESAASSMLSAPPRQRFLPTVDQFSSPLQNQYHMADGPMFPRMADHHAPDPFFALGAEFRPFHEHYPSPQDEARAANNFRRRADPMLADPLLFNQHGEDIVNALFEPMDVFEHFPPMQAMHRTVDAASYPSPTRERGHDMRALPAFQAFPELHQPRQVDPILFTTVAQLPEGWQNVAQNPDPHISDAVPHTAAADPMQEEHDPTHPQYMQWNRRGA